MYWFKRKYQQIKRVIDFLPLIWKGYDFDYYYSLELFKKQLGRQATFLESNKSYRIDSKHHASRIRTAIKLMDKVYDEEYGTDTEYMDTIEKLYGKTHYDFVELEEVSKRTGEKLYEIKIWNENAVDNEHQEEIDKVRNQMMYHSKDKQKRAHKLLWDFIEHNIQNWLD